MHPVGAGIGTQARTTERPVEVDLHRDAEARVVVLAPDARLDLERDQREPLLVVVERGVHFTGVQLHSDANGVFTGTVTIDGYPVVSEDGRALLDDQSRSVITTRDAAGAVLQETPAAGAPPVTGVRMGVGAPGFPAGAPAAGTPTP